MNWLMHSVPQNMNMARMSKVGTDANCRSIFLPEGHRATVCSSLPRTSKIKTRKRQEHNVTVNVASR